MPCCSVILHINVKLSCVLFLWHINDDDDDDKQYFVRYWYDYMRSFEGSPCCRYQEACYASIHYSIKYLTVTCAEVKETDILPRLLCKAVKPTRWLAAGSGTKVAESCKSATRQTKSTTKKFISCFTKAENDCKRWPEVEIPTGNSELRVLQ